MLEAIENRNGFEEVVSEVKPAHISLLIRVSLYSQR